MEQKLIRMASDVQVAAKLAVQVLEDMKNGKMEGTKENAKNLALKHIRLANEAQEKLSDALAEEVARNG